MDCKLFSSKSVKHPRLNVRKEKWSIYNELHKIYIKIYINIPQVLQLLGTKLHTVLENCP